MSEYPPVFKIDSSIKIDESMVVPGKIYKANSMAQIIKRKPETIDTILEDINK